MQKYTCHIFGENLVTCIKDQGVGETYLINQNTKMAFLEVSVIDKVIRVSRVWGFLPNDVPPLAHNQE